MRITAAALLSVLACLAAGCSSQQDSMLVVSVDAPNTVAAAYYLRVKLNNQGDPDYRQFPASKLGTPLVFPTSFGLYLPPERTGTLVVEVDALDADGVKTLASGSGSVSISVGERMDLCVGLAPSCSGGSSGTNPDGSSSSSDGGLSNNPSSNSDMRTNTRGGLPAGLRFLQVSAGVDHTCAVAVDGSLWCWGDNSLGQLGLGDNEDTLRPTSVVGSSWTAVAAGSAVTCAIQSSGALACWGNNGSGQVGNGTAKANSYVAIPLQIEGIWQGVSVGSYHALALQPDGALFSWGNNSSDQLGDQTAPSAGRASPGLVNDRPWLTATGTTFAAGNLHSCALGADHSLWCWGDNSNGQLGDGTTHMRLNPTQIPGTDWAQISGGFYHTCALKTDGSLWCWGDNSNGQLGTGNTTAVRVPTQVTTATAKWSAVTTGHAHTCGLQIDGSLWCWGGNSDGQLGSAQATVTPAQVSGAISAWKNASAGDGHTCAVASDGTLWCWGRNKNGQVGIGGTTNQTTPAVLGT
jgi:alpha-tubulin suppressor-like RCC1 family protein